MAIIKNYQDKSAAAPEKQVIHAAPEAPKGNTGESVKQIKRECPLCHSDNVIYQELTGGVTIINCQRTGCLYVAKYVNGRLV